MSVWLLWRHKSIEKREIKQSDFIKAVQLGLFVIAVTDKK
jgi:hypothetical protein